MFSPYIDKIDYVYDYLQTDFKIADYGELGKYLGIELDRCPYGSIHIRQTYPTQRIINIIPVMDKPRDMPTLVVKPNLEKNERSQMIENDFNYRSVIGSLNLLTNSMHPEAQFALLIAYPKLPHDEAVNQILSTSRV